MTNKENIHSPEETALSASEIAGVDFAPVFIGHWPCVENEIRKDLQEVVEAIVRAHLDGGRFGLALLIPNPQSIYCAVFNQSVMTSRARFQHITDLLSEMLVPDDGCKGAFSALCSPLFSPERDFRAVSLLWFNPQQEFVCEWNARAVCDEDGLFCALEEWVEVDDDV